MTEPKIVRAKHEPYFETGHLAHVIEEMRTQGPPTIRVMLQPDGTYHALEGSHRVAAAHYLGLEPKLVVEIPECGDELERFWSTITDRLPVYEFPSIFVLKLSDFALRPSALKEP